MRQLGRTIGGLPVAVCLLEAVALAQGWGELVEVHGFFEQRAGWRTVGDLYQKDVSVMEARTQLDAFAAPEWGQVQAKLDAVVDGVDGEGRFELRELNLQVSPLEQVDLKVGRQALTWGTGDLLFVNDLFPKDWIAFFVGRDIEYLKAPADAVKASGFFGWLSVTAIYTPQFDPDRYIDGSRLSYWNPALGRIAGRDAVLQADRPGRAFTHDEWALRLAADAGRYEVALYGYWGYWKSPGGFDPATGLLTYPRLDVYGGSMEGPLGRGIANLEVGWYRSRQDPDGDDPMVNNSQIRCLAGYRQELLRDLSAGVQYYLEQIRDYDRYLAAAPPGPVQDRVRQVATLRLTWLLMNQNLICSFFCYYSPSDSDAYLRPNIAFKVSDHLSASIGANIFTGPRRHTFFGQFRYDTNLYGGLRFSF